jgi:ERCC4-type nuclease
MTKFKDLCAELEEQIVASYEDGVSMEQAEKLAAKFLHAQMIVSGELKKADLDSRMRKNGVKSIRAAIYLDIVQKADKKPTEAQIGAMIDTDSLVAGEQRSFDEAEANRDEMERYYGIFQNGHIYFRGIAKGNFNG